MKKFLLLTIALLMLISAGANAQLIGEGDTLWFKTGLPTITQVQFTPDGTKLGVYVGGNEGKTIIVYEAMSGEELWRYKFPFFTNNFHFSIDGSLVYVLTPTEKTVYGYSSQTGEIIETNTYGNETNETYWNLWLTPNPNRFLFTSPTGKNAIYDKIQKSIIKEKLSNAVTKIYASPYSNYFIKATQYESNNEWKFRVSLWDINTLDFITNLVEDFGLVETGGDIKISYNGKYAATAFGSRALQIWDLENKKLFKEYSPAIPTQTTSGGGPQSALAFCRDNETIINCGGYYLDDLKASPTTITNFKNDKRSMIYQNMTGFRNFDINKDDTALAAASFYNLVILKLKKDAVPVKENLVEQQATIYPNPTTGHITVNIPEKFGKITSIRIFDNLGKIVKSYLPNELNYQGTNLTLSLFGVQTGNYILQISSAKNIISYKIILER